MDRPLAVITGASAGLGVEFARQLARRGFDLVLVARREDRLRQTAALITGQYSVQCEICVADLASDAGIERVAARLAAEPRLELLVNNAGFGSLGLFWTNTPENQNHMHHVHVIATMRLCHAALQGMVARDRGGIVNVSSVAAFALRAGSVSYCATKAWINRFTEGLWAELQLKKSRVRVQALCPGYTRTEFHQSIEMDTSSIPNWMWLRAERVVQDSLRALDRGVVIEIPSKRYRAMLAAYSLLPGSRQRKLAIGGQRYSKPKGNTPA